MPRFQTWALAGALSLTLATPAIAHFGFILPSQDVVDPAASTELELAVGFGHPHDASLLSAAAPQRVAVLVEGAETDLTDQLISHEDEAGRNWWSLTLPLSAPGDHVVYANPTPFWEPGEDSYIVHHVKVVANVGGEGASWREPLGAERLPAEIVPHTRPYGLWAGQAFSGILTYQGQPVAGATVEMERCHWQGRSGPALAAPTPAHVTLETTTAADGSFTVTLPAPGWWGIAGLVGPEQQAAISGSAESITHPEHGAKPVEVGGVLWLYAWPAEPAD